MVFGKKKTLSERMKDLLSEVDLLSDEEQEKFWEEVEGKYDGDKVNANEQKEGAETGFEEKTSERRDLRSHERETNSRRDEYDGNETGEIWTDCNSGQNDDDRYPKEKREEDRSGAAKVRSEENDKSDENRGDNVNNALLARVATLEETVAKILKYEEKQDFGIKASLPHGSEDTDGMKAVMRGYAKNNYRAYM